MAAKVEERDGRLASGETRPSEGVLRRLGFILVPALMAYWLWDVRSSATAGHWIEVVGALLAMALVAWLSLVWLSDAIRENRRRELRQAADAARDVLARPSGESAGETAPGPVT